MTLKSVNHFYYYASGEVLTDMFTFEQMSDPQFDVTEHVSQAFEDWCKDDIIGLIRGIAKAMHHAYLLGRGSEC